MKRFALHLLALLCVALAVILAWLWFTPAGQLRNAHWQPPAAQKNDYAAMVPSLPGVMSADASQFIALRERPLFAPTRRPPPPPPPVAEAPPDNLSAARLSGTYQGSGAGGVILNIAGKDRRVALKSSFEGWTLQSIEGRSATFARGGQTRILQLPRAALTNYTGQPRAQAPADRPLPQAVQAPAQSTATSGAEAPPPSSAVPSFGVSRPRPRSPSN